MSWRIVQVTQPCRLSVKQRQLFYEPFEAESVKIPLEDISVLILENKQISFNNALISELAENNIVFFSCDFTHMPSGSFFPFHNHSRYSEIAWVQVEVSEPLKKRLWQEVVKQKIINQAQVLSVLNKSNAKQLQEIAKNVQSGDSKNAEAFAASIYWKSLFNNFNRGNDADIRNSALNYGYAIIRGCMARSIVGSGLIPCFGIHHANKLNPFNLVDDMMEPFRPFVDCQIYHLNWENIAELTPLIKQQILEILTHTCYFNNEYISLLKACELSATSLVKAIKSKSAAYLMLPLLNKLPLFAKDI